MGWETKGLNESNREERVGRDRGRGVVYMWSSIRFGSMNYYRTHVGTHRLVLSKILNRPFTTHAQQRDRKIERERKKEKKGCLSHFPCVPLFFLSSSLLRLLFVAVAVTCLRGGLASKSIAFLLANDPQRIGSRVGG